MEHRGFLGQHDTIMIETYDYTFVNYNVNYRLWVIVMCQCRFISFDKCTTLMGMLKMRGNECVGTVHIWDISVPFAQCCRDSKAALKKN